MLTAFVAAVLLQQAPDLGQIEILGRHVPITLPEYPAIYKADVVTLKAGDLQYPVLDRGEIGPPFRADGGWGEIRQAYDVARGRASEAAVWKTRVFLLTRAELLETTADGVLRTRNSTLERAQIDAILRELATLHAIALGATGGRLRLQFVASTDDDPARETVEPGSGDPFGPGFVERDLAPRINEAAFEVDDKEDRGPFDSVFYIHAGLSRSTPLAMVGATPISGLAYNPEPLAAKPGGAALWLWRAMQPHFDAALSRVGYPRLGSGVPLDGPIGRVELGMGALLPSEAWAVLPRSRPWSDADYVARRWPKATSTDNLLELPRLRPDAPRATDSVPAWQWPLVRGRAAAIRETETASLLDVSRRPDVPGATDVSLPREVPNPNVGLQPRAWGAFTAEVATDAERGPVANVVEAGPARRGAVELLDRPIRVPRDRTLRFWFKNASRDALALRLRGPEAWIVLSGDDRTPVEIGPAKDVVIYRPIASDGTWQAVDVPMSLMPGEGDVPLDGIEFGPPRAGAYYERARFERAGTSIALTAEVVATEGEPSPGAPQPSETAALCARLALISDLGNEETKTIVLGALASPQPLVRLNALAVLTRAKLPEAVPTIADQSRSANAFIAAFAMRALAFQETAEAEAALRRGLDVGPFEHTRAAAVGVLAKRAAPELASPISVLWPSPSWRVRRLGAEAIAAIKSREAAIMLMTFLQEIDPCVRLAVTQGVGVDLDLVNRRLLYGAVNDPSEAVRAASYVKLIESGLAEYRVEGYKGVRDESEAVRLAVVRHLADAPKPEHRQALQLAVTDARASVRAAALAAFARLPGEVAWAEIENVGSDGDPRVQRALLALAKGKALAVPAAVRQKLAQSVDPEVRSAAEGS